MKIALFPLDVVLFPSVPLPLHIFEERYKEMVGECLGRGLPFGVVRAQQEGLAIIGCTATITRVLRQYPDGQIDILCEGGRRFEIEQLDTSRSFLQAEVDFVEDEEGWPVTREERAECVAMHLEWELPADLGFKQQLLISRSDRERTRLLKEFYEELLSKLRMGALGRPQDSRNGHGPIM